MSEAEEWTVELSNADWKTETITLLEGGFDENGVFRGRGVDESGQHWDIIIRFEGG